MHDWKRPKVLSLLGLSAVVCAVAGCGSSSSGNATSAGGAAGTSAAVQSTSSAAATGSAGGTLVIGSAIGPTIPAIVDAMDGEKQTAASAKGLKVKVLFNPASTGPTQASALQQYIAQGVGAIIVDPIDTASAIPAVNEAKSKGIPVITVSDQINSSAVISHISSNEKQSAATVAKYVATQLGGNGQIGIVGGDPTSEVGQLRLSGVHTELAKYPGITIGAFGSGNWLEDTAANVASAMVAAHPKLQAIIALSDAMARGVYESVKAAGAQDRVMVVGYNGTCPALASVWHGEMKATLFQDWRGFGVRAVEQAIAAREHKAVQKTIVEPSSVVDKQVMQAVMNGQDTSSPTLTASVRQAVKGCPGSQ